MSGQPRKTVAKNRRRRKFIRPDMQLKVVFITLFVSSLTLVVQMRTGLASIDEISRNLTEELTVFQVLSYIEASTIRGLFLSMLVALPLAVACGVLYSFRFAGPVYRFQEYFSQLCGGRWDVRCNLRKNDHLQDVAESINGAIDDARDRMCEDQSILQDVKHLLTNTVFTTDEASRELVAGLQVRIQAAEEDFERRFPDAVMSPVDLKAAPVEDSAEDALDEPSQEDRPTVGQQG
jgi:hypothetical protein